jgi:hypothetical protein
VKHDYDLRIAEIERENMFWGGCVASPFSSSAIILSALVTGEFAASSAMGTPVSMLCETLEK